MSAIGTRAPTRAEAVGILKQALTKAQVKADLAYWRERYGDEFADSVYAQSLAAAKKEKWRAKR